MNGKRTAQLLLWGTFVSVGLAPVWMVLHALGAPGEVGVALITVQLGGLFAQWAGIYRSVVSS